MFFSGGSLLPGHTVHILYTCAVSLLHEIYRCDYIVNFRMLMRRNGVGLVLNNLLKLKHVVNLKEEQVNKLNKDTEY